VYDECRARFVSEYGVIGPCHVGSIKQYLGQAKPTPGTRAWQVHTNTFEKATIPAAIRLHYADPEKLGLREYLLYGQMFQATMYGRSVEALRFRKHDPRDDCQGALIWMYNDCWGEIGWTIIDYYLRRKPSYYWFRRAAAPFRPIVRRRGGSLVTRIVNDTLEKRTVTISHGWMRVDGSDSRMRKRRVRVPANGMVEAAREKIPGRTAIDPREWLYAAYVEDADAGDVPPAVWTLAPHRELQLAKPFMEVAAGNRSAKIVSPVYCHGVHVDDRGRSVVSDNYFDLLPGVPVTVRRTDGGNARKLHFRAVMPKN